MIFVFAQVIGFVAFAIYAYSFWQKDRRKILLLEVCECLLYSMHYFLMGASTGGFINIIGAIRSGSFIYKNKNKFMSTNILPSIFLFAYVLNAILTWEGFITLLPTLGSVILMLTIWQHNTKLIRRNSIFVQLLWIVYATFIGSWVVVCTEIILLFSTSWAIIRLDILKDKKPNFKIVINGYLSTLEKIFDSNNQNFVYDKSSIKDDAYIKFICVKKNKVLGYVAVYPKADFMQKQGFPSYTPMSPFSVFIWHIVVRRGYERQGIATMLIDEIKKVYHGYEIYSVLDSRNNASIYFHNINGFVKKFDFERVYYGKLEKFDLMLLKNATKELSIPSFQEKKPNIAPAQNLTAESGK